jgi:low affinity Fe/Cu permease
MTSTDSVPVPVSDDDADAPAQRQEWLDRKREEVAAGQSSSRWHHALFNGPSAASSASPGWEHRHWTSRALHRVGAVASHSVAGVVALVLVVMWAVVGVFSGFAPWWQTTLYSVTASVTFVMVFVIQHAQERQTSGTQRKLDELIRSSTHADNSLIAVEEAPDEHLQALAHLNLADRERELGRQAPGTASSTDRKA